MEIEIEVIKIAHFTLAILGVESQRKNQRNKEWWSPEVDDK
jgi:hypothetical protein